jgi:DNA-directed RNA polymerase subunit RPC12/RpoP
MMDMITMHERGYREYTCPECGYEPFWMHHGDGDETEVTCPACGYQTTAGDVRNRE